MTTHSRQASAPKAFPCFTASSTSLRRVLTRFSSACVLAGLGLVTASVHAVNFPITPSQRQTAQQIAQAGIPLSELVPNAPDSHVVKTGDTLWDISKLFLKSPWRWPELWGMNMEQIRNPHLIYPGQVLYLERSGDRAHLRVGQPVGNTLKLVPRVRSKDLGLNPIASIPFHLIEPFLNEAVIFEKNELELAPRIVATQEGRVVLSKGDTAYVRGDLGADTAYRIFRQPKPLIDPTTKEILGFEAVYVGTANYIRAGDTRPGPDGKPEIVPATFTVSSLRLEAGVGDRLTPVASREFTNYAPRRPDNPIGGQIASIYGDGLIAGQNQIVALNKGERDGVERGHVLALWRDGIHAVDSTDASRPVMKLPDERHGLLFVFRVFDRMSYALVLTVQEPVKAGDRFTEP
jgi:LysM domain